jgi:IS66 Orf2 like protein.
MLQITPQMRILAAVEAVDFRKGIDGLCRLSRDVMKSDPYSGYVYSGPICQDKNLPFLSYSKSMYFS